MATKSRCCAVLVASSFVVCAKAPAPAPVARPPQPNGDVVSGVEEVAVGNTFAGCARLAGGAVECWAGGAARQEAARGKREPARGPLLIEPLVATQLVGGAERFCAVTAEGDVACFREGVPPEAQGLRDVVQVGLGASHLCALTKTGEVVCKGNEMNGALGFRPLPKWTGPRAWPDFGPERVPGIERAVSLSVGQYGTCAVEADGDLVCFGVHPFRGPHRDEDSARAATAVMKVQGMPPVDRVAVAGDLGCVRTKDRRVMCARRRDSDKPSALVTLEPKSALERTVALSVSPESACMVTDDGEVWCWGPGPAGYLIEAQAAAQRADAYERPAWRVEGIANAVQVSVGFTLACATTRAKNVLCWGANDMGERGDGTLETASAPTYLVRYAPKQLSGPPAEVFGCKRSTEVEARCAAISTTCALEPPPGYWNWGSRGGAYCGGECMRREEAEVHSRPIPGCLCTCEPDYQRLMEVENRRRLEPPPP